MVMDSKNRKSEVSLEGPQNLLPRETTEMEMGTDKNVPWQQT